MPRTYNLKKTEDILKDKYSEDDFVSLVISIRQYLNGKFSYNYNELSKYYLFFKINNNSINITNKVNKDIGRIEIQYKDNEVIYIIKIYEYGIKTFKNYISVSKYIKEYKNYISNKGGVNDLE